MDDDEDESTRKVSSVEETDVETEDETEDEEAEEDVDQEDELETEEKELSLELLQRDVLLWLLLLDDLDDA